MWQRSSRSCFLTSNSTRLSPQRCGRLKLKDVCHPLVLVPLIFSCLKSSAILLNSSVSGSSFRQRSHLMVSQFSLPPFMSVFVLQNLEAATFLKVQAVFMAKWYDNIWYSSSSCLDDSVPLAWDENLCCFLCSFCCRMHRVKLHVGVP